MGVILCSDNSKILLGWATSSIGWVVVEFRGRGSLSAGIIILTAWYIGRIIADKGEIIEYGAIRAARQFWFDAIITDIVFTAILGVDVQLVITVGDSSLGLALVLNAGETVGKNLKFF